MIKTIPTHQVRIGMYIEAIQGAWIDNPFWKKAFKLDGIEDLKKLQESIVKEVMIDTSKGLDVEQAVVALSEDGPPKQAELEITLPVKPVKLSVARVTNAQERAKAKTIINASKKAVTSMFNDMRMGRAANTDFAVPLVEQISESLERNEGALISLVRLKTKDNYTYMHSVAVCALMIRLARELQLSELDVKQAGLAGLLHDVGKSSIPNELLNKPGALTSAEFDEVKLHPERGYALLQQAEITDAATLEVCLHHHEKIDGSGYPHQLNGSQISLIAKIAAVCDVYDAVTSDRPYKSGWCPAVSLHRMAQWTGHFEPKVFEAFVKCLGIYPVGSFVSLNSGRLGLVIDQSGKSLLQPIVKVFFSTTHKCRIPIEVLDLSKSDVKDQIIGFEDPALWGITDANDLWD